MAVIQWLLVGGPADGKKITVLSGAEVRWSGTNGDKNCLYKGCNYQYRGRMYRIGFVDANDLLPSKVERLIDETDLRHFAG